MDEKPKKTYEEFVQGWEAVKNWKPEDGPAFPGYKGETDIYNSINRETLGKAIRFLAYAAEYIDFTKKFRVVLEHNPETKDVEFYYFLKD